ncbi:MAG: FecR domain-containing protein [Planctomycetes bacterium]|nr:FecR domain-containing protein [Planctomycetota bacterium]
MRTLSLSTLLLSLALGLAQAHAADAAAPTSPAPAVAGDAKPAEAKPLASWSTGDGTIAGAAATSGAPIASGVALAAGAAKPATVQLLTAPGSVVVLGAGAGFSLTTEAVADGKEALIINLESGAIQVHIASKGDYESVHVRGAAIDVRVTGTLFVVERVKRDSDYIALVQGKVKVSLRKEVADSLHKQGEVELITRQGVGGSTSGGLGAVESISSRPQLSSASHSTVREQALGESDDGHWNQDAAAAELGLSLSMADGEDALGTENGGLTHFDTGISDGLVDSLTDHIGTQVFDSLEGPTGLSSQVLDNLSGVGAGELPGPPPPPPR